MIVQLFVICLGPICIPIWGLFPIVLLFLQKCYAYFKGEKVDFFNYSSVTKKNKENSDNKDGKETTKKAGNLRGTKRYTEVIVIDSDDKYHEILKTSKTLVVVDFTASWCGPCQQIKPAFKQFAKEYNAEFLQVDVDEFDDIAHDAEVNAMPTFQLYANGEKIDELVGANEDNLRKLIELNIGKSKDS